MLIKFGICINELGIDTRMFNSEDSYEKLKFYVCKKLDYCLQKCNELYIAGVKHVRLPNLMPPVYSKEDFNQLLYWLKSCNQYKLLKRIPVSFSFHIPYRFNELKFTDCLNMRKYICDLGKLMYCLSLHDYTIVCHVKDNNISKQNKFLRMISTIPTKFRQSVVIENDEYHTTIEDCIKLQTLTQCPVVFDNLHNKLNGCVDVDSGLMDKVSKTWRLSGRPQKIHYSSYSRYSNNGHGSVIDVEDMLNIISSLGNNSGTIIIMLEIKNSREALEAFKYRTENIINWKNGFCVEI